MEVSNLARWSALIGFAIAIGTLLRSRFGSASEDAHSELVTEYTSALVASATLGSLPRLFSVDIGIVHWVTDGISLALSVFAFVQMRRLFRLTMVQPSE